jgi:hypothetical protein
MRSMSGRKRLGLGGLKEVQLLQDANPARPFKGRQDAAAIVEREPVRVNAARFLKEG